MSRRIASDPLPGQAEEGVQHDWGVGMNKQAGNFLCLYMYLYMRLYVCVFVLRLYAFLR